MTEPVSYRQRLPLEPLDILRRAARMGRALVGIRAGGALLERIGTFDGVALESGRIVAHGPAHDTWIDPAAVVSIVADRSETPHDTILNYVDFLDATGTSVVKVTALDGPEGFEAALADLPRSPLPYVPPLPRATGTVDPADIGAVPLLAAQESGATVTLSAVREGGGQSWTGRIGRVHFGHNYINVIQEEVHLHLRGGEIARWDAIEAAGRVRLAAIRSSGEPLGLAISGEKDAFLPATAVAA